MNVRHASSFALLAAAVLPLAAVRPAPALTMDAAVRRALVNNLDLRAAYFEVDKARARLLQAGLWPNPALEVVGTSDRFFGDENQRIVTVGFNQAFPVTGRLRFGQAAARVEVAQAIAEIRNRERLLIGEVERAFVAVVAGQEAVAARRELLGINQGFVDLSEQRLQAAQGSQVDVNLARLEAQRLRQEIAILETDRQSNVFALRQKLGLGPQTPLSVEGTLASVAARLAPRGNEVTFAGRRPDLRGLELTVDRAQAEGRLARATAWGEPTLGLTYERDRAVDEPAGIKVDEYLGLRVAVPLAFFDRGQGKVREQAAAARQARAQFAALELSIRDEIAAARQRAERLQAVFESYQRQILPLTGQNTELLTQGYREGKTDFTQIFQSQTLGVGFRTAAVDFARDRVNALVDLQTAAATSPFLNGDFLREHRGKRLPAAK